MHTSIPAPPARRKDEDAAWMMLVSAGARTMPYYTYASTGELFLYGWFPKLYIIGARAYIVLAQKLRSRPRYGFVDGLGAPKIIQSPCPAARAIALSGLIDR